MKLQAGNTQIVVGKRVTVGAVITSTATAIAFFYPDYAVAIMASAVPITFIVQLLIAHYSSVTTK